MSLHEVLEMNRAEQALLMNNNNNNDKNNDNNKNNNDNDNDNDTVFFLCRYLSIFAIILNGFLIMIIRYTRLGRLSIEKDKRG